MLTGVKDANLKMTNFWANTAWVVLLSDLVGWHFDCTVYDWRIWRSGM